MNWQLEKLNFRSSFPYLGKQERGFRPQLLSFSRVTSFVFFLSGINISTIVMEGKLQVSHVFGQVNNIKNRSKDNQNDRKIDKNYTPPANNSGGSNTYTPPPAQNRSYDTPSNNYYNSRPRTNYNLYSRSPNNKNDTTSGYNGTDACCVAIVSIFSSFLNHQNFLIQSKVVNPRIVSFEIFALEAIPFIYRDSSKNNFFPATLLSMPKIRANWGMLSTELRYTHLHQFGVGSYQTTDWQVIMLNIFSRREFYLRIGTGFMYERASDIYFNEHSISSDIMLSQKLSGSFEFRFSHDGTTKIFPRLESGLRLNYLLTETKYADFNFTFGFLYQNYYQTDRLYMLQTGLSMLLH